MFSKKKEWTCNSQEEKTRCSKGSSERTRYTKRTSSRRDSLLRYSRQVWRLVEGEGLGKQSTSGQDEVFFTEGHCRGSEKSHNNKKKKESKKECNREFLELARDILCFENHMQVAEEENQRYGQRYGWAMKREVRWHSLQVKLQQNMFV